MKNEDLNLATLAQIFADEDAALAFFESKRWPDGPVCPHCGASKVYGLSSHSETIKPIRKGVYKCSHCRKQFSARIGTILEESHLPIRKWLMAIHLMTSSKKGISSLQLKRELGVAIKTAWFLSHRIREAMTEQRSQGLLGGTVEVDETYIGGKPRKGGGGSKRGRGTEKTPVMVLVERDGKARTERLNRITAKDLKGAIKTHVASDSKIVTDEFPSYKGINKDFTGGHSMVNHSAGQYVNKEGEHTNTAESFFALLKRGHYGIFHSLSKEHLHRYGNEFAFRWNQRKVTDGERMVAALEGTEGKRLMYKKPKGYTEVNSLV